MTLEVDRRQVIAYRAAAQGLHREASDVEALAVLDIGVQATQVNNLAQIYGLDETAHSRINTVYMTTMFLGGAAGTYGGVLAWNFGGWTLVCCQLLLWAVLALALLLFRLCSEKERRA